MLTTGRAELDSLSRTLRDHGASRSDLERHQQRYSFLLAEYHHLGYNFRMTDIQGALGVAQMRKADRILDSRREAAARYDSLLEGTEWLRLPFRHPDYVHGQQSYVCLFAPEEPSMRTVDELFARRNEIMASLEADGIITRQGTHAAAHVPYYAERYGIRPEDYPNAYLAERLSLTLPMYAGMTESESEQVVEALQGQAVAL
jgi:perosamine synthetase